MALDVAAAAAGAPVAGRVSKYASANFVETTTSAAFAAAAVVVGCGGAAAAAAQAAFLDADLAAAAGPP